MRVIIIDKTYADSERTNGPFAALNTAMPDDYPMKCREKDYPNMGAAIADNPGKTVMLVTAYQAMHKVLRNTHSDKLNQRDAKTKEINEAEEAKARAHMAANPDTIHAE